MALNSMGLQAERLSDMSVLDHDRIGSLMLWPPAVRASKRGKKAAERAAEAIAFERLFTAGIFERGAGPAERHHILQLARNTPSKADLMPETKAALRRGVIAGSMLCHVVSMAVLAPELATLSDISIRIAKRWARERVSVKTINKIWPAYRPVAAYWAAYIALAESRGPVEQIPCRPDEVPLFLAIAWKYRGLAENTRMKQRGETLLKSGETLDLPDGIVADLPEIDIDFTMRDPA